MGRPRRARSRQPMGRPRRARSKARWNATPVRGLPEIECRHRPRRLPAPKDGRLATIHGKNWVHQHHRFVGRILAGRSPETGPGQDSFHLPVWAIPIYEDAIWSPERPCYLPTTHGPLSGRPSRPDPPRLSR
jgi:hypothetical protein